MQPKNYASNPAVLSTATNYSTLQEKLDVVIGRIGLCRTIQLIGSFIDNSSISVDETEKFKLITRYIIAQSIEVFDLRSDEFYTNKIQEYRDARMACFRLLRAYTNCSYAKIGEEFDQKKRNIIYYCQKCEDTLSVPSFYPVFVGRFKQLEQRVIQFIAKLS